MRTLPPSQRARLKTEPSSSPCAGPAQIDAPLRARSFRRAIPRDERLHLDNQLSKMPGIFHGVIS